MLPSACAGPRKTSTCKQPESPTIPPPSHRVIDIAAINTDDGLTFDQQTITAQPIREDGTYAGVRVRPVATLGRAQIPVGIDVNFGDPIWPAPTEITMPRLVQIGQRPVRILGYPLSMVIAEQIVTALERAEANTRWRDFADVLTISGTHEIPGNDLRAALETVAAYRGTILHPLHLAHAAMPERPRPSGPSGAANRPTPTNYPRNSMTSCAPSPHSRTRYWTIRHPRKVTGTQPG